MKYLSICDGIGAAHIWKERLGWTCVGASEIEPFPITVVKANHPEIPHLGDMTKYHEWKIDRPDLVCGGTPCQSFSVAGLRAGLADPRGNLALVFLGIIDHFRPRWVVWENVPGVFSSTSHEAADLYPPDVPLDVVAEQDGVDTDGYDADEDHAFNCFVAGLEELGYGVFYRVLDAQYFGVPQRRRRPFVVGYLGDWRPPTAVLLEPESMSGNPPPSRRKGERITPAVTACATGGGGPRGDFHYDGGLVAACDVADTLSVGANQPTGFVGDVIAETVGALCSHGDGTDGQDAYSGRILPVEAVEAFAPSVDSPLTARMLKGVNTTMDEGQTMVPVAFKFRGGGNSTGERGGAPASGGGTGYLGQEECAFTLSTSEDQMISVPEPQAFDITGIPAKTGGKEADVHVPLRARQPGQSEGSTTTVVATRLAVRRLTPRECERLQAFQVRCEPDTPGAWCDEAGRWWTKDYTAIPWRGKPASECPDGPRYKALGNSWCRNVVLWIGRRIQLVEEIKSSLP